MFSLALILYGIFIVGYGTFAAALIYHVHKFAVPEDPLHTFIIPFVTLSLIVIILSFYFFLQVPWNNLV